MQDYGEIFERYIDAPSGPNSLTTPENKMFSPSKFSLAILAFTLISQVLGLSLEPKIRSRHYTEKRDGVVHTIFEDDATGGTVDFVTNSGICETTPGVNQYSGYFSVGSMFSFCYLKTMAYKFRESKYVVLVFRSSPQCALSTPCFVGKWRTWLLIHDWVIPGKMKTVIGNSKLTTFRKMVPANSTIMPQLPL